MIQYKVRVFGRRGCMVAIKKDELVNKRQHRYIFQWGRDSFTRENCRGVLLAEL